MPQRSKQQLSFQVLKQFRLIFGAVRQHFREVEQSCGVSGSQLWILKELANAPGIGVSDLAERLFIHQSTCSQLVEKLVARGFVVKARDGADQRRVGLVLSEVARTTVSQAPGPAEGVLPEALKSMSEVDILNLNTALSALIGQLHVKDQHYADKPLADL